jgi:catechol 2,3-dioxygenase-like lactoylglutathione lyase family enzyme
MTIRIALTSVMVDDQAKAHRFYTDTLGFVTKHDIPMGEFRWLTVVSPEGSGEVELLLEPNQHPAAKVFQKALRDDGIPATSFACADVQAEYDRLTALGVAFRGPPKQAGPVMVATFDDTCGNLIQIHQG